MKKLKIINIDEYNYTLEDEMLNKYTKALDFYGAEKPSVGDFIYMPEKVLKEINIFTYGIVSNEEIDNINIEDLIKIQTKEKEYYLKRLYG